jgi:hypothetical protein
LLLLVTFVYVLRFGQRQTTFLSTVSWPITWTLLAAFFAYSAYVLIFYQ